MCRGCSSSNVAKTAQDFMKLRDAASSAGRGGARRWNCSCLTSREINMHLNLSLHSVDMLLELGLVSNDEHALVIQGMPVWGAGVFDADHLNPYSDNCLWIAHFWNPYTGTNYKGMKWPTAKTFVSQWWATSTTFAGETNSMAALVKSMYDFGLSMHFIGDITQPMHSGNYPNTPTNLWHSEFEEACQQWLNLPEMVEKTKNAIDGTYGSQLPEYITELHNQSPDAIFRTAAIESVVFLPQLKAMHGYFSNDLDAAKKLLPSILAPAFVNIAAFMLRWIKRVMPLTLRPNVSTVAEQLVALREAMKKDGQWSHDNLKAWRDALAVQRCKSTDDMRMLCVNGAPVVEQQQGVTNPYSPSYSTAVAACPTTLQRKTCPPDLTGYIPRKCASAEDCVQSYRYATSCDGLMCTDGNSCKSPYVGQPYCEP